MRKETRWLLGLDLAKAKDYTSLAAIEVSTRKDGLYHYHLSDTIRFTGIEYPMIEAAVVAIFTKLSELNPVGTYTNREPDFKTSLDEAQWRKEHPTWKADTSRPYDELWSDGPHLCMDASGLGAPIRDNLRKYAMFDRFHKLFPVVFVGGEGISEDPTEHGFNISKSRMVANFVSIYQHRRIDFPQDYDTGPLVREMNAFRSQTTKSGHITFNAEIGEHDDIICSVMIPLIIGEEIFANRPRPLNIPIPAKSIHGNQGRPFNPQMW